MGNFDMDSYLNNKFGGVTQQKMDDINAAKAAKLVSLDKFRSNLAGTYNAVHANDDSFVAQQGIDPNSVIGEVANLGASAYAGTSRLVGNVVGLPHAISSAIDTNTAAEGSVDARNRLKQGLATAADMALLNDKRYVADPTETPEQQALGATQMAASKTKTNLELLDRAAQSTQTSRGINEAFDRSSVVHNANRDALGADLKAGFGDAWNEYTTGGQQMYDGKVVEGAGNALAGMARLIYNTGEAAAKNPKAVLEYAAENAPQLLMGLAGKAGSIAQGVTNVGYAVDNFQQGMQNYAAKNNGQMPSDSERATMAMQAASLALAEQVGDKVGTKLIKSGGSDVVAEAGKAIGARQAFVNTLKRTGAATAEGAATETGTEGYQTYMEGEVTGKKATAEDIYSGAVIGGFSGAALSGGGHGIHEVLARMTGQSEDQQHNAQLTQVAKADFTKAVFANDPSAYLNQGDTNYSPLKAVGVLHQHSQLKDTTPEVKQANLEQASQILGDMEAKYSNDKGNLRDSSKMTAEDVASNKEQIAAIQAKLATVDQADTEKVSVLTQSIQDLKDMNALVNPKARRAKEAELGATERQIRDTKGVQQDLASRLQASPDTAVTPEHVQQTVAAADTTVDVQDTAAVSTASAAVDRLITLSMANTSHLTAESATQLADNASNSLSDGQRTYMRAFSEARIAENSLKTGADVHNDVMSGGNGYTGIEQHRAAITHALNYSTPTVVSEKMDALATFAKGHQAKSVAASAAMADVASGKAPGVQLMVSEKGTWSRVKGQSDAAIKANGGMTIGKGSVAYVGAIKNEAKALSASVKEMQAAIALKQSPVSVAPTVATAPTASPSAQIAPAVTPSPVTQPVQPKESTNVAQAPEGIQAETQGSQAPETAAPSGRVADTTKAVSEGVAEATTAEVVEATGLNVLNQPQSEAGTEYRKRNLITDYFTQAKSKVTDVTARPLVQVKDFLSKLIAKEVKAEDYLPTGTELSGKQEALINMFKKLATQWEAKYQPSLLRKTNPLFHHEDMIQFLMEATGTTDKFDLEQNVKTAMSVAAFAWLAESTGKSQYNTAEEINMILQKEESHEPTPTEWSALGKVGVRENVVRNSLGQKAVAALALKTNKEGSPDLMARLESALGAHIEKMMMDQGLMTRTTISGKDMRSLTGNTTTKEDAKFYFLKVTRDAEGAPTKVAKDIWEASKDTQGVFNKLFDVESGMKDPSLVPIETKQKTTKNTKQRVPSILERIVAHENKVANFVRQDMWHLMAQVSPEIALQMAGKAENTTQGTHASKRDSLNAKNDGLQREYDNFMEFVGNMEDNTAPMYFEHSVWKQQRVGISTNTINPQSSKIHRFMLYRQAWETKVDINDADQISNFQLRVAEGLGVKTDKKSTEAALTEFKAKMQAPEVKRAVALLRKVNAGQSLNDTEQQQLADAVKFGGSNFHSLDAFMALAHYADAKATGKTEFTVHMMGEVDGVTNGPMLSHLLLGAANSVSSLFALLNKGGFYELGNTQTQYNEWRGTAGNTDLYESTSLNMTKAVATLAYGNSSMSGTLSAIYAFTGSLVTDAGVVTKDGRNIIKKPLTSMLFGSSLSKAIDGMADKFIESIHSKIEDLSLKGESASEVVKNLNTLLKGYPLKANLTIEELMEVQFTSKQIEALKESFAGSIGKAVEATMKEDFADFLAVRATTTATSNMAFELYKAAFTGMRAEFIKELAAKGEITLNEKGVPVQSLTDAQEAALAKQLEAIQPIMHTMMSKESGQLDAGLYLAKSERKMSEDPTYQGEVKFGTGFADNGVKSAVTRGTEVVQTNPGVGSLVMSIHSTDSAISHLALDGNEVLNVHDAHGTGLKDFVQTAQNLNKATWQAMLAYSPATELYEALARTVAGYAALVQKEDTPQSVKDGLLKTLEGMVNKKNPDVTVILRAILQQAHHTAVTADKMKYEALTKMASVDQYALAGGNYEVTDKDRAAAQAKLDGLVEGMSKEAQADLLIIEKALGFVAQTEKAAETAPKVAPVNATSMWGKLGKSSIKSDPHLVKFFAANPEVEGKTALKEIQAMLEQQEQTPEVQAQLLLIPKILAAISPDMTVRYLTEQTQAQDLLSVPMGESRGWYTSRGSADAIHLLGPMFVQSGLTTELVLHEMYHAALMRTIDREEQSLASNPNYTSDALALVQDLETLRAKAVAYAKKEGITKWGPALASTHEMISWGMTNKEFQEQIMAMVTMKSATKANKLVVENGMKAFIKSIVGLLFKGKSNQATAVNGMSVLIANVSGLLAQTPKNLVLDGYGTAAMANSANASIYTTEQLFDALEDPTASMPSGFSEHLKGLLSGIVTKLHGPFGSFKDMVGPNMPMTQAETFQKALATGIAPFASYALAANIRFNDQTAFVLEQVEATMRMALNSGDSKVFAASTMLRGLYVEQKNRLTAKDFHKGDWATATLLEQQEAQGFYDFIFTMDSQKGNVEDHLARFAALGLTHPEFNALLQVPTARKAGKSGGSVVDALQNALQTILDWFSDKLTHTEAGMRADKKLTALVEQLIHIETKRKERLADTSRSFTAPIEDKIKELSEAARVKIEAAGRSPFFANSKSNIVKLAGSAASTVAGNRVLVVMEGIRKLADEQTKGTHGVILGLVDNVLGQGKEVDTLLRGTKSIETNRKFIIDQTNKAVLESFANGGKDLTDEQKSVLTPVLLRTGAHALLGQYSIAQIENLMTDGAALQTEITSFEGQLSAFPADIKNYFLTQSRVLAYYLATDRVTGEHMMMNAGNIASLYATGEESRLTDTQARTATDIIDTLVTLQALAYTRTTDRVAAAEVMKAEAARTDGGNGAQMLMLQHKALELDARNRIFNDSEALMVKGYVPEIYNPYTAIEVADDVEGADLVNRGYSKGDLVSPDPLDPNRTDKHIYILRDGGQHAYNSGVFSTTGMNSKGATQHLGKNDKPAFLGRKAAATNRIFRANPGFDPTKVNQSFMAPILNADGEVTDYHYLMQASTKDTLLERDSRFDRVMGVMAGSTYDKESSAGQNKIAVQALFDQYQADYASNPTAYITVGPKSTEPALRDAFRMLPYSTRMEIEKVWGKDGMKVQKSMIDVFFGYRKESLSTLFDKQDNNIAARAFTTSVEFALESYARHYLHLSSVDSANYTKRASVTVARAEHMWQAVVKEVKANFVVKSVSTMTGNMISNETLLFMHGVPFVEGKKQMYIAYRGAMDYSRDNARLFQLKNQLEIGMGGRNTTKVEQEIAQLEDALARNPVKPMIDAGLLPTIDEGLAPEEDSYSYKSRLMRKTEKYSSMVHPTIKTVSNNIFMTKDTALYRGMSKVTQLSDFVARYALYQHLTTQKTGQLSHEDAVFEASESFINYDIPMQRKLQYMDDMGLMMFTKYFLGIQRVIVKRTKEKPARALMLLLATNYLHLTNTVLHSSALKHAGRSPITTGAFAFPGSFQAVAPIHMGLGIFN